MEPLDYDANKYLIVTISNPSALRDVHPAIAHIGQVGQLKDLHRLSVSNRDWDNEKDAILESLRRSGVSRIDYDKLQQRSRRQDEL
jgi:hypothetical protein